ncbi:MAG: hypothetical protein RLZZ44_724 [Bacteroidota bacterium]
MNFKLFQTSKKEKQGLALWIALIVLSYFAHHYFFELAGIPVEVFSYSLLCLYLFFGFFSILLLVVVFRVRSRHFDLLGMTFLIVTTIKMLACFVMARPILKSISVTASLEKINFFMMFVVFLAIETTVVILILNEKQ